MMDPLVVAVVVGTEDVEVLRPAAEFRVQPAGDHVPRLKLRLSILFSGSRLFRVVRVDCDMDDRFAVTDAGARIDFAHCVGCGDGCAHELRLKLRTATFGERVEESGVAATPGNK